MRTILHDIIGVYYLILFSSLIQFCNAQILWLPKAGEINHCFNCTSIGWHCYLYQIGNGCQSESNYTSAWHGCISQDPFFTNNSINLQYSNENNCSITEYLPATPDYPIGTSCTVSADNPNITICYTPYDLSSSSTVSTLALTTLFAIAIITTYIISPTLFFE